MCTSPHTQGRRCGEKRLVKFYCSTLLSFTVTFRSVNIIFFSYFYIVLSKCQGIVVVVLEKIRRRFSLYGNKFSIFYLIFPLYSVAADVGMCAGCCALSRGRRAIVLIWNKIISFEVVPKSSYSTAHNNVMRLLKSHLTFIEFRFNEFIRDERSELRKKTIL